MEVLFIKKLPNKPVPNGKKMPNERVPNGKKLPNEPAPNGNKEEKMILVMLGTQNNDFSRLLKEIDNLIDKHVIKDEVVVQAGYTKYESKNMKIFDLIPKDKLLSLQQKSDLIITHGGVGSIISSIEKGKKVIAVPRKHEYLEHVNNHQEEIVQTFNDKGYIIGIEDVKDLENAIIKSREFIPKKYIHDNTKMLKIIEDFIEKVE